MISSMNDADIFLNTLPVKRRNPTERLAFIRSVLVSLGSPQNRVPAIHIAGTSGKGSTAYYAAELLRQAGYSVGLMVSPHVRSVKERTQINGLLLPDDEYISRFNEFLTVMSEVELSYIEFVTVFAFWLFAAYDVEYVVIEVGLGGTLDSTNVISRSHTVRVITDIGYDHMEILGTTLAAIAAQKAGIIRFGDIVTLYKQSREIMHAVEGRASRKSAAVHVISTATAPPIVLNHLPQYQQRNWLLAFHAVTARLTHDKQPELTVNMLQQSTAVQIPGRFEKRVHRGVSVVLDAAHNPQKMQALISALRTFEPTKRPVVVIAFGNNKHDSAKESLSIIASVASCVVATEFHIEFTSGHRSISAETIGLLVQNGTRLIIEPSLEKALNAAFVIAKEQGTYVVVTGSFYLLDNVYSFIADRN